MALAWRVSAYGGVMSMRVEQQQHRKDTPPSPAVPPPRQPPRAAASPPGSGGFLRPGATSAPGVTVLDLAAFSAVHPGLIERKRAAAPS